MSLITELKDFVHDHRPHGTLTGDATEPPGTGTCSRWRVRVVLCSCGGRLPRMLTQTLYESPG
jgi:hypothetical protein